MADAGDWFYRAYGREIGPLTFDDLIELARTQQIGADDQVKLGSAGKWRRAGSLGRLMAALPFEATVIRVNQPTASLSTASVAVADVKDRAPSRRIPSEGVVVPVVSRTPANSTVPPDSRQTEQNRRGEAPRGIPVPKQAMEPAVTPASIESDSEILQCVRADLAARNLPSLTRLELNLHEGVLTIRGGLSSEGERLLAIRVAAQIRGVARVVDAITVARAQRSVTPRSMPVMATVRMPPKSSPGPGVFSKILEGVQGEHRNPAIGVVLVAGLLGFWFFPRGPVRPVAVHPVKGRVVIDGQPLANAAVVLHRVGDSKLPANVHPRGKAIGDGSFALETFDPGDGAPVGDFVATVFLTEEKEIDGEKQAGPNLLPVVYSKPESSPLKLKITSATKELQPLELRR